VRTTFGDFEVVVESEVLKVKLLRGGRCEWAKTAAYGAFRTKRAEEAKTHEAPVVGSSRQLGFRVVSNHPD
jgi:hypothetical protein